MSENEKVVTAAPVDVELLVRMINCSQLGWPNVEEPAKAINMVRALAAERDCYKGQHEDVWPIKLGHERERAERAEAALKEQVNETGAWIPIERYTHLCAVEAKLDEAEAKNEKLRAVVEAAKWLSHAADSQVIGREPKVVTFTYAGLGLSRLRTELQSLEDSCGKP